MGRKAGRDVKGMYVMIVGLCVSTVFAIVAAALPATSQALVGVKVRQRCNDEPRVSEIRDPSPIVKRRDEDEDKSTRVRADGSTDRAVLQLYPGRDTLRVVPAQQEPSPASENRKDCGAVWRVHSDHPVSESCDPMSAIGRPSWPGITGSDVDVKADRPQGRGVHLPHQGIQQCHLGSVDRQHGNVRTGRRWWVPLVSF